MGKQLIKLDLDSTDSLDFERQVSIPTPDGRDLKIPFIYRYRDRAAVAQLLDRYAERARAAQPADDATVTELLQQSLDFEVSALLDIATGWGLDGVPFNADNVRKLCMRYAGAANAVITDYRVSFTQGRLGN